MSWSGNLNTGGSVLGQIVLGLGSAQGVTQDGGASDGGTFSVAAAAVRLLARSGSSSGFVWAHADASYPNETLKSVSATASATFTGSSDFTYVEAVPVPVSGSSAGTFSSVAAVQYFPNHPISVSATASATFTATISYIRTFGWRQVVSSSGAFSESLVVSVQHAWSVVSVASASGTIVASATTVGDKLVEATASGTISGELYGSPIPGEFEFPSTVGTFGAVASVVVLRSYSQALGSSGNFSAVASVVFEGSIAVGATSGASIAGRASVNRIAVLSTSDSANIYGQVGINGVNVFAYSSATATTQATGATPSKASASATFTATAVAGSTNLPEVFDSATFTTTVKGWVPRAIPLSLSASATFPFQLTSVRNTTIQVQVSDSATFDSEADYTGNYGYAVASSTTGWFTDRTSLSILHAFDAPAFASYGRFADEADVSVLRSLSKSAATNGVFSGASSESRSALALSAAAGTISTATAGAALKPRSATDSATFAAAAKSNNYFQAPASASANFTVNAVASVVGLGASASATFATNAATMVALPNGNTVPGGDISPGLRTVLYDGLSREFPLNYAESADGTVLMGNGVDPVLAWDGSASKVWRAGLDAPASACSISGSGNGLITGRRWAYVRFLDARNRVSNLSLVSNYVDLGDDAWITGMFYDSSGAVTCRSPSHGLLTGNTVTIQGANGLPIANGVWTVTVVDADTFTIDGLAITGGVYLGGGTWTRGASSVFYENVPVPQDEKVVRRQLLRNLRGTTDVFYVDVDTSDLVATTFSSTQTDEQLATCEPVPIFFTKGDGGAEVARSRFPAASRHGVPPSHKTVFAAYSGRVFAAVDRVYSTGNVSVVSGSTAVVGVGTAWTAAMASRLLYVSGTSPSPIASVDAENQLLTLESPWDGPSELFALYAIRPAPVERLLVYCSEPYLAESWPSWNAFSVPETSDEITALVAMRSFLFIIKERHIFKFSFREDPAKDGYVFPVVVRGSVNNRCCVRVDERCYMLDEMGVHVFDGGESRPIGEAVQSIFREDPSLAYRVDWTTDRTFWHASHDQTNGVIRWVIDFVGARSLTMALCYDYRSNQWWIEQYVEPVTSSTLAFLSNHRRPVFGTTCRRVLCLEGASDVLPDSTTGTLSGTATGGDTLSLVDSSASFPQNLAGASVALVGGTGSGQQAVISSNTSTTITLVAPWSVPPDATTQYRIGAVTWKWRSGWRRFAADEAENPRDVEFVFHPTIATSSVVTNLYYDHSETPVAWSYDQDRDGISIASGEPGVTVDLTTPIGYAVQRMSGHSDPYGLSNVFFAFEIQGAQSVEPQRIYQVVASGVE